MLYSKRWQLFFLQHNDSVDDSSFNIFIGKIPSITNLQLNLENRFVLT